MLEIRFSASLGWYVALHRVVARARHLLEPNARIPTALG